MFDTENQFFPTPASVIEKMLAPYVRTFKHERHEGVVTYLKLDTPILEPSAGSGAILDAIAAYGTNTREMMAIEIDPELRLILTGKKYKVISSDFLSYEEPQQFGFIAMNPPFNEGDKHILKAFSLLRDGCDMVALISSETIRNPYSKTRQLLVDTIAAHGIVEELGACFKDSDRPTDVEISMIRLTKPKSREVNEFDQSGFNRDYISEEEFSANPLAHADYLSSLVAQYKSCERLIIERNKLSKQLDYYLKGTHQPISDRVKIDIEKGNRQKLSEEIADLKNRFWNTVFTKAKIANRLTGSFKRDFEKFRSEQQNMAFDANNIQELLLTFFGNYEEIMLNCLVEIFDKLTAHTKENRVHTEGWVTNKGYRLNHKVIYPYGVTFEWNSFSCYRANETLNDIDKTLCWLSGIRFEDLGSDSTYNALSNAVLDINRNEKPYTDVISSKFFEMRIYKKGTLHLHFRDRELLNTFNVKAAQGKKWIGGEGF